MFSKIGNSGNMNWKSWNYGDDVMQTKEKAKEQNYE